MNKLVIVGNWKMNKSLKEAKAFLGDYAKLMETEKSKIGSNVSYGIAAPFTAMGAFENKGQLMLAAQNFSQYNSGAYTGEVSADMLLDLGVQMVVLGHSERRQYFGETNEVVNAKMHQALNKGLMPIVCVGETLQEYEQGKTKEVIKEQISKSLANLKDYSKVIVAYEPIWAIGTGKTATPQIAQDICAFIRSLTSPDLVIQYGGSVSPANVADLMSQKDINGALVGGASLEAASFLKLLTLGK